MSLGGTMGREVRWVVESVELVYTIGLNLY